jgi:malate synthase
VCLKHGAVPIGGMATALPNPDPDVNRVAAEAIRADKEWEARQGFLRGWVAHIFHMKTAAEPFKRWHGPGWKTTPEMADPERYPVRIEVPEGPVTLEGTRRNCRMLIEYLEGWLNGRGAKGIDSLEGKPGVHPALMEDLATGRMSVAQIAQRIRHRARTTDGPAATHDFALVKRLLAEELEDILKRRPPDPALHDRYRRAVKIAARWIRNYVDLDFRSLGSYRRASSLTAASTSAVSKQTWWSPSPRRARKRATPVPGAVGSSSSTSVSPASSRAARTPWSGTSASFSSGSPSTSR